MITVYQSPDRVAAWLVKMPARYRDFELVRLKAADKALYAKVVKELARVRKDSK